MLTIPIFIWSLWITTYYKNSNVGQKDKVEIYLSYFPEFVQSVNTISLIVIFFAVCSAILSAFGRDTENKSMRLVSYITFIFSCIVLGLQFWTML